MKYRWSLYVLGAWIVQSFAAGIAGVPASAETYGEAANRKHADARKEEGKAVHERAKARADSSEGRGLRSELHADHAARLESRARKHENEARTDRQIAKHHYR